MVYKIFNRKIVYFLRHFLLKIRMFYLNYVWGTNIHPTVRISLKAKIDKTNPKGIFIDRNTHISFGVVVLSHDMSRKIHCDTKIGSNCFVGGNSIIMPGVQVGNGVVIGAGSIVTKSVPDNVVVAGNPARIIRENIQVGKYGIFE